MAGRQNVIPVFDPEHDSLKAVPAEQAQHFADLGYDVGDNAKNRALQNSPDAKIGAFLTRIGNAGSVGLLNLGLAATGYKGALKNAARAAEANPKSALAGDVAGIVGSTIAAPFALGGKAAIGGAYALGGIGEKALAYGAERGGLANLVTKGANLVAQGAGASALQGASDEVTQSALLDHPVTIEKVASSALSDVLWNAAFIGGTHAVLKTPSYIAKGAGNILDKLEHWGVLKAEYKKAGDELAQTGPKISSTTQIFDREYAASPEPGLPFEETPSVEQNLHLGDGAGTKGLSVEEKKAAEATGGALDRMPHDLTPEPGLPADVSDNLKAGISAKTPLVPELEAVPSVEPLSVKKARAKAAKASAEAEQIQNIVPEDVEPAFDWPDTYNKQQKLHVLREYVLDVLEQADPEAQGMWQKIQNLEDKATELGRIHKADIKAGGVGIPDYETQVKKLWNEKADLKEFLGELAPAKIDKEAGSYIPGFNELNAEYARVANPEGHLRDLERPAFSTKASKQASIAEATHAKALSKAEEAEENLRILEEHQAEVRARHETIERNRKAKADSSAAGKKAAAEEKAERQAVAAKAKAEKETARKAAADARAAEQKARASLREAEAAARKAEGAAKAEIPRASAGPKSAKTQSYQTVEQGPEGIRRETVTRKEANGRIKEKHRVVIKAPKVPPKMEFKRYKKPFKDEGITSLGVTGFVSGLGSITSPIALGMKAANGAVYLAGHRAKIGRFFDGVSSVLGKMQPGIVATHRIAKRQGQSTATAPTYDIKDYDHIAKSAAYLSSNPAAVQGYMDTKYPALAKAHPKAHHETTVAIMRAINAFHQRIPKTPYDPTLLESNFRPTRAQQIEVLRNWSMLANPSAILNYANPANVEMAAEAYPALTDDYRADIIRQLQADNRSLSGRSARQVSTFLGANVRFIDDAKTLKRLQETAGPEPMKPPQGGSSSGGSSKITSQAVQRDMPTDGLSQLGS